MIKFLLFWLAVLGSKVHGLIDCPYYETHFQKVIGYYPLASSSINWNNLRVYPTPLECLKLCQDDSSCSGFVYNVNETKCYGFDLEYSVNEALDQRKLIPDSQIIFYEKVCLNLPRECRDANKAWPIFRIPGTTLIGAGFKHINRLVTRRQCTELCLGEREFICKSASFRLTRRNNYNRERERDYVIADDTSDDEGPLLGECILSREDKNSKPDAFRVANDLGEEYIENQCVPQDFVENQCSYERYLNAQFLYADDVTRGLTEKECQERCDNEPRFKCIGVTYRGKLHPGTRENTECALHSDDIISLGPRSMRRSTTAGSVYMRRVRCLNVNVICDGSTMIVRYLPEQYFVGKLYVNADSRKNCSEQSADDLGLLRIPIGNETRENSCGIVRAYHLANTSSSLSISSSTPPHLPHNNRTLISATIVIQNHPSVESQGDRLIKVGCILNGSGKSLNGADRQSKVLDIVDSEVQVAGLGVPVKGPAKLRPHIQLVDTDNNIESKLVEVGQNLQLRVFYQEFNGYDLEVVNLKASSPEGHEIYLLDYKGCPINDAIFPEMMTADLDGVHTLVGQFVAFKFAESTEVDLSMIIRACYKSCPPRICQKSRSKRSPQINPVVFPTSTATLAPVVFPMTIVFPNNNTNKYMVNEQAVEEDPQPMTTENHYLPDSLHNSIENVVHQRVISSFDEPFDDKVRKLGDTSHVEIKELFQNFSKMIEFPVTIRMQVYSTSDNVSPESLIYGENSYNPLQPPDWEDTSTQASNTICIDQTFILCLLLFFGILVIVLVIGCALMLFRYKRKLQEEEDRNSLQRFQYGFEPFDSFRRVHWADGFANARSAYP